MKTKNAHNFLLVMGLFFFVLGCSNLPTKTEELRSGRLKYVETLKYGPAGTHGSDGWYVSDRNFYVNDHYWHPPDGVKATDIGGCEASPNPGVELLKCRGYVELNTVIFILRMKVDNQAEWVKASSTPFNSGDDPGEWVGDGHWLIFKDFYFNVETSERKEIKGLPAYTHNNFLAASPDMGKIIYKESCLPQQYDRGMPLNEADHEKQCRAYDDHIKNNLAVFWLIDATGGKLQTLELKREKYPWIVDDKGFYPADWIKEFNAKLVWEKDARGKYQLTYPN